MRDGTIARARGIPGETPLDRRSPERFVRHLALALLGAGLGSGFSTPAAAGGDVDILEARGCYYYRGRQHCGRYCYWEVNGRRYCREREDEAHPQGFVYGYEAEPGRYRRGGPAVMK